MWALPQTRSALYRRLCSVLLLAGTLFVPAVARADSVRMVPDAGITEIRRVAAVPPYRTQLEDGRYAGSNCGPATLGMTLEAFGVELSNLELRRLTHTLQGNWPGRGGTDLRYMDEVAQSFGLKTYGLYAPGAEPLSKDYFTWTTDDVAAQVQASRIVIPLVRYGLLPGHEDTGVRYGHYILIYAVDGEGFRYHDPAFRPYDQGVGRWLSREQLDRAMAPTFPARQALSLGAS
jgi:hypothetical protein